jgi:hypothetical protein
VIGILSEFYIGDCIYGTTVFKVINKSYDFFFEKKKQINAADFVDLAVPLICESAAI